MTIGSKSRIGAFGRLIDLAVIQVRIEALGVMGRLPFATDDTRRKFAKKVLDLHRDKCDVWWIQLFDDLSDETNDIVMHLEDEHADLVELYKKL